MRKLFATVAVSAALLIGGFVAAAPASATTEYPGGGIWNYGCTNSCAAGYSDYYWAADWHGSSTCTYLTTGQICNRSANTAPSQWSRSSQSSSGGPGNLQYYYR